MDSFVPVKPLAASSFLYSLYASFLHPTEAFYSPISRSWELAAGSILALHGNKRLLPVPAQFVSVLGITMIVIAALAFRENMRFPAPAALMPVLGAVAVIMAGGDTFIGSCLASRPLVAVGLISYPLYLWHWPVLAFCRIVMPEPSRFLILAAVAASILLAVLTHRLTLQLHIYL